MSAGRACVRECANRKKQDASIEPSCTVEKDWCATAKRIKRPRYYFNKANREVKSDKDSSPNIYNLKESILH